MLYSLQYMRGVAALMIVVYHLHPRLLAMGWQGYWPNWLSSGVDMFFVLSGFLMWTTTRSGQASSASFITRRLYRIAPLYWAVTIFAATIMIAAPSANAHGDVSFSNIVSSLLFIPYIDADSGRFEPIVPQGWTLNYEMAFYVVFAASLLFRNSIRLSIMIGILVFACAVGLFIRSENTIQSFYTDEIIIEFAFGIVLGALYPNHIRRFGNYGLGLLALGSIALVASDLIIPQSSRVVRYGVPAAAIMLGCLNIEIVRPVPRDFFLKLLGDSSYSLYLVHGIVLSAVSLVWSRWNLHTSIFGLLLYMTVATLGS
ncbi:MAG: acyltransferase, partial [Polynucleobacter sp.]|nr:acyltransferase [Polynucleobacter sp.]